jgi:hypothetical protein
MSTSVNAKNVTKFNTYYKSLIYLGRKVPKTSEQKITILSGHIKL